MDVVNSNLSLLVWSLALVASVSISQGWSQNSRGSAVAIRQIVKLVSGLLAVFCTVLIAAAVYDFGWSILVAMILVMALGGVVAGLVQGILGAPGGVAAVIAMPIFTFFAAQQVTWFGMH